MPPKNKRRAKPLGSRPVTATYLRNAAMHYLSGRSASTAMLRQTLQRRAKRRLDVTSLGDDSKELIDKAIADLVGLGLINDAKFAEYRAASLARKGLSKRRIAEGLRIKGIVGATAAKAIGDDLDELTQARRFIERKRLGAHRRATATPETRDKDLRALARAGFSFRIAAAALADPGDG